MGERGGEGVCTVALEAGGGGGEEKLVLHSLRPAAGCDSRLLRPLLDPVDEPLEVTVTVQRVVTQRPET